MSYKFQRTLGCCLKLNKTDITHKSPSTTGNKELLKKSRKRGGRKEGRNGVEEMVNFLSSCAFLLVICAMLFMVNSFSTVDAIGDYQHHLGWIPGGSFVIEEEEFQMDTEINRRILATTKYISYGALQRNSVPCSRRGASYYNCQSGAQANPYQRGCSAITRCRR